MTDQTSRRDLMMGAAVAGAALATAPALAQPGTPSPTADPQTKYVSEPFAEQKQPWPALQRDMKPVPDCGEKSYRGSGKLKGRKALVTGGVNVYPADVERAIGEHPDVAGVVVTGVPDPDWGERVVALVAPRPGSTGLDEASVIAFLRGRIASYKIPKRVAIVALDDLPTASSGKPLRRAAKSHPAL